MPSFLVESYAAASSDALDEACERARRAAELAEDVRYVRTTFLPGDETILHLFEAPSVSALDKAARRAALPFERIVEAVDGNEVGAEETTRVRSPFHRNARSRAEGRK